MAKKGKQKNLAVLKLHSTSARKSCTVYSLSVYILIFTRCNVCLHTWARGVQ